MTLSRTLLKEIEVAIETAKIHGEKEIQFTLEAIIAAAESDTKKQLAYYVANYVKSSLEVKNEQPIILI